MGELLREREYILIKDKIYISKLIIVDMEHCSNCGKKIIQGASFCEGCGEELYEEDDEIVIERSPKERAARNTLIIHRLIEMFILFNIILILYSLKVNWGYFYLDRTWINLGTTSALSLINIGLLIGIYNVSRKFLLAFIGIVIISFILALGGHILYNLFGLFAIEAIVLYIFLFWSEHNMRK